MTITAEMIADSTSPSGHRLCTLQLRYPRFIHAEFMTHRMFSRNASSSRAIPVEKLIEDVIADTAMPIHWGKNQPGMQAREECESLISAGFDDDGEEVMQSREEAWADIRDEACAAAMAFSDAGYHKQIVNRLLEPFSHINVVVTATEWDNFMELRNHPDAQPEIMALAQLIEEEMLYSETRHLAAHEWHLPYVSDKERSEYQDDQLTQVSAARCARVSYLTHDGKTPELGADLKLFDRLVGSAPLHASPLEHPARPWSRGGSCYNLTGWQSFRHHWDSIGA